VRHIPVPSLPQIELRSFNQQLVTLVAEQLQGQSAHWLPEAQLCRTEYVLRYYTLIGAAWVWANMAVPGSEQRNGGGGRGNTREEIKEEEIFCNYVNQISAPLSLQQEYVEAL
jgi:hypothetical protein